MLIIPAQSPSDRSVTSAPTPHNSLETIPDREAAQRAGANPPITQLTRRQREDQLVSLLTSRFESLKKWDSLSTAERNHLTDEFAEAFGAPAGGSYSLTATIEAVRNLRINGISTEINISLGGENETQYGSASYALGHRETLRVDFAESFALSNLHAPELSQIFRKHISILENVRQLSSAEIDPLREDLRMLFAGYGYPIAETSMRLFIYRAADFAGTFLISVESSSGASFAILRFNPHTHVSAMGKLDSWAFDPEWKKQMAPIELPTVVSTPGTSRGGDPSQVGISLGENYLPIRFANPPDTFELGPIAGISLGEPILKEGVTAVPYTTLNAAQDVCDEGEIHYTRSGRPFRIVQHRFDGMLHKRPQSYPIKEATAAQRIRYRHSLGGQIGEELASKLKALTPDELMTLAEAQGYRDLVDVQPPARTVALERSSNGEWKVPAGVRLPRGFSIDIPRKQRFWNSPTIDIPAPQIGKGVGDPTITKAQYTGVLQELFGDEVVSAAYDLYRSMAGRGTDERKLLQLLKRDDLAAVEFVFNELYANLDPDWKGSLRGAILSELSGRWDAQERKEALQLLLRSRLKPAA